MVLGVNFMGSFLLKGVELGSIRLSRGMMIVSMIIMMKMKFIGCELWGVKC